MSRAKKVKVENVEIVSEIANTQVDTKKAYLSRVLSNIDARISFEISSRNVTKHTLAVLDNAKRLFSSDKFLSFAFEHAINDSLFTVSDKKHALINIKSVEEILNVTKTLAQDLTLSQAVANRVSFVKYAQIALRAINENKTKMQFSNAELRRAFAKNHFDTSTQVAQTSIFICALLALKLASRSVDESAINVAEKHCITIDRDNALLNKMLSASA